MAKPKRVRTRSRNSSRQKPARIALAPRLLEICNRENWFSPGTRVGVAASGGADSTALLLLLVDLRKQLGIVPSAVHFNHKLRGKPSDSDERFVVALAERLGLPVHLSHADVAARARREKSNLEDAARRARYAFFEKLSREGIVDYVVTAHTADDQAETVLAHILRGTGLAGLAAIHPKTDHVIRPLLQIHRADLRKFLRAKKQPWREDATNQDTSRLRARIRKKLLPLLEKQFQPNVIEHLSTLATLAREDDSFLNTLAAQRLAQLAQHSADSIVIPISEFSVDSALASRLIRLIAEKSRARSGQWSAQHVQQVLDLALHGEPGKLLQMPASIDVRRDRDVLTFSSRSSSNFREAASRNFAYPIDIASDDSRVPVPELGCAFRFRVIDWPLTRRDTIVDSRFALDRDRLREPLELRSWRPGDRLRLPGRSSAQKIKRLLTELRVSPFQRSGWPVLTSGGVLAWARGFPAAAEFAADERTRTGIVISEEQL